ncbi:MAG TPA: DNA-directed RNA polymerase subunit alpha [Phycisphaerae bacterium]|nr:DNA-directed RNA polymerase subunit alpha [Phycisphaerae bacterium]
MRIRWRGLELPTRVMRDDAASQGNYGRFVVEPFERGFGTTVGNSLRRILLSSLESSAVTHVRIKGVDHEFMTIPGVLEDVTEIILNVKSLVVNLSTDQPKTMRVSVRGKAGATTEVRASALQADAAIDIINRDHLICTLTDNVEIEMEMTVARGRSYVTAEENKGVEQEQVIGEIPVDSVFSPVSRVRYRVEDTRVGQRTNYDRLVMEIWTNGTLSPEMALVEAAKILRKHLNPFVQYFELGSGLAIEGQSHGGHSMGLSNADQSKLALPISVLDLSVRASNCLASANIATIGDLMLREEADLLKLRSFGKTSLREVKRKLTDFGLTLRSSIGVNLDEDDDEEEEEEPMQTAAPGPSRFGGVPAGRPGIAPLDSGSMGSISGYSSPNAVEPGSRMMDSDVDIEPR